MGVWGEGVGEGGRHQESKIMPPMEGRDEGESVGGRKECRREGMGMGDTKTLKFL